MTTTTSVRIRRHQLLLGGSWSEASTGDTVVLDSPATGEPVAEVAAAGAADVERAVTLAHESFERHRWRTPFERAAELERIADVIDRRRDEMAGHLALEHGKPLAEAIGEIGSAASGFRLAAGEARRLTGGPTEGLPTLWVGQEPPHCSRPGPGVARGYEQALDARRGG